MTTTTKKDIFDEMAEKWPSALVGTPQIKQFTGGILSGKTLQNLSTEGKPIPESIRIGRRRAWRVNSLCDWLRERSEGTHNV